jgi:O-succinylbenzoic acid--CoA ligase
MKLNGEEEILEKLETAWNNGDQTFTLFTSGSTGSPKKQELKRELLIWSAEQTRKHFIQSTSWKQLIALPLTKAGGFMQWVRSKVWDAEIDVLAPCANPMLTYSGDARIISLTPHQLFHILESEESIERLSQFETVLIGGAPLSAALEIKILNTWPKVHFVHTFGMTETYSHFAGRTLGEKHYLSIDQTQIRTSNEGQLEISNPTTNFDWLNTKDRVEIIGENTFKWLGRSDFTINSGGLKIQIEDIEAQICEHFQITENDFCCWFEEDQALGQKLIMLLKKEIISSNSLANFEKQIKEKLGILAPKSIHLLDQLIFTESGKIDRRASFQYTRFC